MNGKITLASSFSGLQADISQTSPAQLAASVRKSTLDRPFILPILKESSVHFLADCGTPEVVKQVIQIKK